MDEGDGQITVTMSHVHLLGFRLLAFGFWLLAWDLEVGSACTWEDALITSTKGQEERLTRARSKRAPYE